MSFGHRFIYVGVGGSGQTIGRQLEKILRDQICGPNGNKARLNGGALPELRPFELPRFIQTIYIDFAESDLETTATSLHRDPNIVNATATFIHALPKFSASNQITNQLRTSENAITQSWLPPKIGDWGTEPTFAPLAVGAGQYPTIGRAALFAMLSDRGPEGILNQFETALGRITSSKGDLKRYNPNGQIQDKVIMLVGGSFSGGTGGGTIYDLIQLLTARATEKLGSDVTVIPLITLPRNFDAVLGESKRRSSRLNAARAMADLGALVDEQNAPSPVSIAPIEYPHGHSVQVKAGLIKSVFLFDRPIDAHGVPVEHSIARFALDLVSDVETPKEDASKRTNDRSMPLLDKMINDNGLLQLNHPTFVGNRPFAMAATVEIRDQIRDVAKMISEDILSDYLLESGDVIRRDAPAVAELREAFAKQVGLYAPEEAPEQLRADNRTYVSQARSYSELNEAHKAWRTELEEFTRSAEDVDRFAGAKTAVSRTLQLLSSDPIKVIRIAREISATNARPVYSVLVSMHAALTDIANRKLPYSSVSQEDFKKKISELTRLAFGFPVPVKRVPDEGIEQYCKDVERAKIYEAWEKYLATKGGDALQTRAGEVKERVSEFMRVIEGKAESLKNEKQSRHETLTTPAMLANSQDTKEYFEKTIRNVRESLAGLLNVSKSANSDIAKSLIVATQEDALLDWEIREGGKVDALANSIIEGIQQMVYERLDSQEKLYTTLRALLNSAEVRRGDVTEEQSALTRLGSIILNKVNTSLVPPDVSAEAETRITVSFPGPFSSKKAEWLTHILEGNPLIKQHLKDVIFVPNSASDSIAVGVSKIGLGLLDVPDGAASVNTWVNAAHSPKGTDRLAWRQRTGYRDSIAFVSKRNRVRMLRSLIAAAWNGRLTLLPADSSTPDSFSTLSLHFGNVQADPVLIPLQGAFPNRLAQLPDAFLETVAHLYASGSGRATGHILTELSDLIPEGAKTGLLQPKEAIPDLFNAFVSRHFNTGYSDGKQELDEIYKKIGDIQAERARSMHSEYRGELRLGALEEYRTFWEEDIPAALQEPYNILGFNTLWEMCLDRFGQAIEPSPAKGSVGDPRKRA